MAQYLILLYEDEAAWETADEATLAEVLKGHQVFGEKYGSLRRGGSALQPTATATSIRRDLSLGT